jgi:sugar O-acyltransferase (sialic acid O-acetyltransferase NeuD family)
VIWGAAGFTRVFVDSLDPQDYRVVALFDNAAGLPSPIEGVPVYVGMDGFRGWLKAQGSLDGLHFIVAIGGDRGQTRVSIHEELVRNGLRPLSTTHPSAYVAADVVRAAGSHVLAGATVQVGVELGVETIVNTKASVDHECRIGRGVHIAPGATLAGCVEVGDYAMVGMGALILPRLKIGEGAIVGAGSVVTRDVPAHKVSYGSPAKIIRTRAA